MRNGVDLAQRNHLFCCSASPSASKFIYPCSRYRFRRHETPEIEEGLRPSLYALQAEVQVICSSCEPVSRRAGVARSMSSSIQFPSSSKSRKLWVDCDAGVDDAQGLSQHPLLGQQAHNCHVRFVLCSSSAGPDGPKCRACGHFGGSRQRGQFECSCLFVYGLACVSTHFVLLTRL